MSNSRNESSVNVTAESLSLDGATLTAVEVSAFQSTLVFQPREVISSVEVNIESSGVIAAETDSPSNSADDALDAGLELGRACLDLIGKSVNVVEGDDSGLVISFDDGWKLRILVEGPYESFQVTVGGEVVLVG